MKEVITKMKKILIAILTLVVLSSVCYAASLQSNKVPKATEPIGAVIETASVFIGTVIGTAEQATTGKKEITVKSDTGETKVFPFDETVQFTDKTFHVLTLNQLNPGEKVTVKSVEKK